MGNDKPSILCLTAPHFFALVFVTQKVMETRAFLFHTQYETIRVLAALRAIRYNHIMPVDARKVK